MAAGAVDIRAATSADADWIVAHLLRAWGSTSVVSRGVVHDAGRLPALLAVDRDGDDEIVGCATFRPSDGETELVTLDALRPRTGIGTALLNALTDRARHAASRRLWLITSNDNLDALRFYQRRGLRIVAVHAGAIDAARQVKPSIPARGEHGIPIHDEIELEFALRTTHGERPTASGSA